MYLLGINRNLAAKRDDGNKKEKTQPFRINKKKPGIKVIHNFQKPYLR